MMSKKKMRHNVEGLNPDLTHATERKEGIIHHSIAVGSDDPTDPAKPLRELLRRLHAGENFPSMLTPDEHRAQIRRLMPSMIDWRIPPADFSELQERIFLEQVKIIDEQKPDTFGDMITVILGAKDPPELLFDASWDTFSVTVNNADDEIIDNAYNVLSELKLCREYYRNGECEKAIIAVATIQQLRFSHIIREYDDIVRGATTSAHNRSKLPLSEKKRIAEDAIKLRRDLREKGISEHEVGKQINSEFLPDLAARLGEDITDGKVWNKLAKYLTRLIDR